MGGKRVTLNQPRILFWDIETAHNLAAVFNLQNGDYISPTNIIQERYVICASWKWLGENKVHAVSVLDNPTRFKEDPHDDYYVLQKLHEVLSEADVLVAHNGDRYDLKYTEARMLIQGFDPLPPIKTIDTLKVARKRFLFNSNKLDYLGEILGCGNKIKTSHGLWLRVLKGDKAAIKEMVTYNKEDVNLLERVFEKLKPYITNLPNQQVYDENAERGSCPRCGSDKLTIDGYTITATKKYRRYQCKDCGGYCSDTTAIRNPIGKKCL